MPSVSVLFYREGDDVPCLDWLESLQRKPAEKILAALDRLADLGHEAHNSSRLVEYLGNDLYELRVRYGSVNYRVIYFFFGRTAVVLSSGFTKEREIPPIESERAGSRREQFLLDPEQHHLAL
jgi:phage-related protein